MTSHVKLTLQRSEKYEWHVESGFAGEIGGKALAVLKAHLGGGDAGGTSSGVVAEIDQVIEAAYCHRLGWLAYFVVGDFEASVAFTFERRYSWWTKNDWTGSTVHQSGSIWVTCEEGSGRMGRWAPLQSIVAINDSACPSGCTTTVAGFMGWFPPLPEPLKPFDPFEDDEEEAPDQPADPSKPKDPSKPTDPPPPAEPPPPAPPPPSEPPPAPPPSDPPPPQDPAGDGAGTASSPSGRDEDSRPCA
jgi:hypothetical protein